MTKPRINTGERAGVHIIGHVFSEEFEWIFREQPIADVGIDAIVEKCIDGNPCGKFLALQIKSGKGNVYKSKEGYTYYISNTHYYYWTEIELPVILLCYIKEQKKIYWQEVKQGLIKKTNNKWKINLPFDQILNIKSKHKINHIAVKGKNRLIEISTTKDNFLDKLCNSNQINYAMQSVKMLNLFMETYTEEINKITDFASTLIDMERDFTFDLLLQTQKNNVISVFETFASRLNNEIHITTALFVKTFESHKYNLLVSNMTSNLSEKQAMNSKTSFELEELKNGFGKAIEGMNLLLNSIVVIRVSIKFLEIDPIIKKGETAVKLVVNELMEIKEMCNDLLISVQKKTVYNK